MTCKEFASAVTQRLQQLGCPVYHTAGVPENAHLPYIVWDIPLPGAGCEAMGYVLCRTATYAEAVENAEPLKKALLLDVCIDGILVCLNPLQTEPVREDPTRPFFAGKVTVEAVRPW